LHKNFEFNTELEIVKISEIFPFLAPIANYIYKIAPFWSKLFYLVQKSEIIFTYTYMFKSAHINLSQLQTKHF